ncbi:MAG: transglycosylase SLT domain-containing protein [Alistipes sp.]|nr:transglycosylase SLT domain-containing protein [Alistipes sp.]
MTKKTGLLLTLLVLAAESGVYGTTPASVPVKTFTPWNKEYAPSWLAPKNSVVISEYDHIIKDVAGDKGFDWRLISAIAMQESRFDHDAVSCAGAVGLMQVMPATACGFKVAPDQMTDPLTNVKMGVGLLYQIERTIRFPRSVSEHDRLSITLAAYNCGVGRVLDARRLAVKYSENHNSWNVVSKYLTLLGDPAYYEDPSVRTGIFRDNAQTLGFVAKVLRYYDSYCQIASL